MITNKLQRVLCCHADVVKALLLIAITESLKENNIMALLSKCCSTPETRDLHPTHGQLLTSQEVLTIISNAIFVC